MPALRWLDHPHGPRPYDPHENCDDTGANYPPGLPLKAGTERSSSSPQPLPQRPEISPQGSKT